MAAKYGMVCTYHGRGYRLPWNGAGLTAGWEEEPELRSAGGVGGGMGFPVGVGSRGRTSAGAGYRDNGRGEDADGRGSRERGHGEGVVDAHVRDLWSSRDI
jgi:hypothetical protein